MIIKPIRRIVTPTMTYEAFEYIVKKFKEIDEHIEEIMNEPEMKRAYFNLNHERRKDLTATAHSFYKYIAELTGRMELMKERHRISEPQAQQFERTITKSDLINMVKTKCPDKNRRGHRDCELCDFQNSLKELIKGSRK